MEWLGIAGLVVGVLGVGVAVWLYFRGRRIKRPTFAVRRLTLVENLANRYPDVEMRFRNRPVPNLTVVRIALWNGGRDPIHAEDRPSLDPTVIEVADADVLDAQVVSGSSPANRFDIRLTDGRVEVTFEYIDFRQGAVLQIFHTGTEANSVRILGSIKGAGEWKPSQAGYVRGLVFSIAMPLIGVPAMVAIILGIQATFSLSDRGSGLVAAILGLGLAAFVVLLSARLPKETPPGLSIGLPEQSESGRPRSL